MIDFLQHQSPGYPGRTRDNVIESGATMAFALNFDSSGEVLTKSYCSKYNKTYIPVPLAIITTDMIDRILEELEKYEPTTLNIAGNSIYTIAQIMPKCTQAIVDKVVYDTLTTILSHYKRITLIRSGGQSGVDEAGLKAAIKLDIPAFCLCPKGWPYLTKEGATVRNEYLFKARFDNEIKTKLFEA